MEVHCHQGTGHVLLYRISALECNSTPFFSKYLQYRQATLHRTLWTNLGRSHSLDVKKVEIGVYVAPSWKPKHELVSHFIKYQCIISILDTWIHCSHLLHPPTPSGRVGGEPEESKRHSA